MSVSWGHGYWLVGHRRPHSFMLISRINLINLIHSDCKQTSPHTSMAEVAATFSGAMECARLLLFTFQFQWHPMVVFSVLRHTIYLYEPFAQFVVGFFILFCDTIGLSTANTIFTYEMFFWVWSAHRWDTCFIYRTATMVSIERFFGWMRLFGCFSQVHEENMLFSFELEENIEFSIFVWTAEVFGC